MMPDTINPSDFAANTYVRQGGEHIDVLLAARFPTLQRFEVAGCPFLAIPQDEWTSAKAELACERVLHAHVAGRLRINGVRHVVLTPDISPLKSPGPASIAELLTRRELQIALSVANGKGDKEIARTLGISNYTVREHIRRIFHKLNVCRRTAVVALVLGQGGEPHASSKQPATRADSMSTNSDRRE